MALHHTREIRDIRSMYERVNLGELDSPADSSSDQSYQRTSSGSERSWQSAPTQYSGGSPKRPVIHQRQHENQTPQHSAPRRFFYDREPQDSPRASVETYASTVESDPAEDEDFDRYEVPESVERPYQPVAIPATPSEFSDLFPSHRRLAVRHDDSTLDGNMNLRLDTEVSLHGRDCNMTLFHLRMHDLKNREFSLRRYSRDSGREVCHSTCKPQKQMPQGRPGFQRSIGNAFNQIRSRSEHKTPTLRSLQRNDSGYGSLHSVDLDDDERPRSAGQDAQPQQPHSTEVIRLEFSNYAQVEIKRNKATHSYHFEYWGTSYAWKRIVRDNGNIRETSFHLVKAGSERALAQIRPLFLTSAQAEEEREKGGWIPPCSMRIADEQLIRGQKDVSDVVVASGLVSLVDDAIRTRFHSKAVRQLMIPLPKMQMGMEYIGPKRLINEMFRRESDSGSNGRPSTSRRTSSSGTTTVSGGTRVLAPVVRQPSYGH